MNKNKKIILAIVLFLGIQKTYSMSLFSGKVLDSAGVAKDPLNEKIGVAALATGAGALYLYKNSDTRGSIAHSWLWKSKTALTVGAATASLTYFLPSMVGFKGLIVGDTYLPVRLVPALALCGWTFNQALNWAEYKYNASSVESKRTEWEKELYNIELYNGHKLNTFKKWIDVRHDAETAGIGNIEALNRDVSAKVSSLANGELATLKTLIFDRLKERNEEIQDLEKSTGLINYLVNQLHLDEKSFSRLVSYCMRKNKTDGSYNFETCAQNIPNYYKDNSDLSRYMHIHSFPQLEGFSWNKKVALQWELIKEYVFLSLVNDLTNLSLR